MVHKYGITQMNNLKPSYIGYGKTKNIKFGKTKIIKKKEILILKFLNSLFNNSFLKINTRKKTIYKKIKYSGDL